MARYLSTSSTSIFSDNICLETLLEVLEILADIVYVEVVLMLVLILRLGRVAAINGISRAICDCVTSCHTVPPIGESLMPPLATPFFIYS